MAAFNKGKQVMKSGMPAKMLGEAGRLGAEGFFRGSDFVLHHGGQVALDIAGFVPGVNVLTEGIQAGYHGLHSAWDAHEGRDQEASEEKWEAAEHGAMAGLNLFLGEGGNAAKIATHGAHAVEDAAETGEVVKTLGHAAEDAGHEAGGSGLLHSMTESGEDLRSRMQAHLHLGKKLQVTADGVHKAHAAFDTTETAWDTTSTVVERVSGKNMPFLGGLKPWMSEWAKDPGENDKEK